MDRQRDADDRVVGAATGKEPEPELETDCDTEVPDPKPRIVSTTVVWYTRRTTRIVRAAGLDNMD